MAKELKFIKFDSYMLMVNKVLVLDTSEVLTLTLNDKAIWSYMLSRYQYFKSFGNKYYESQEEIAHKLGVSRDTVVSSIRKLKSIGALDYYKERKQGHVFKNIYTYVLPPHLIKGVKYFCSKGEVIFAKDFFVNTDVKNSSKAESNHQDLPLF